MLEFNELCPTLLDRWMRSGDLPNFKRLHDQSQVFTSVADAEAPALEPWIQWYSMHTGLSYAQHGVFHLTDGPLRDYPDIWSVLRAAGKTVINFSSMNAKGFDVPGSVFVPDPWCTSERPSPKELGVFFDVVAGQVQEYSNSDRGLGLGDLARFGAFVATHGLRPSTAVGTAKLLAEERLKDRALSWKRVAVLDWLYRDVFAHYWRRTKADFATIFLNSTAHLQHSYWRHMDPGAFIVQPTPQDVERFGDAILFGYRNMDGLVGDFMELAGEDTMIVFATALSQQPFTKYEEIGGQRFYRPRDLNALLGRLGVHPRVAQPVMTHQYQLRFNTEEEKWAGAEALGRIALDGEQVFAVTDGEDTSLFVGCQLRRPIGEEARLDFGAADQAPAPFFDHFYQIDALKSGRHHPDGALWFQTGHHQRHAEKVSILDVMPTILDHFQVANRPDSDHAYAGRSLVSRWMLQPA
ncbi:alkaline phosphatase family protein [Leptolyngbya sp. 15MV]|nr:alkaline phosphatase family protein [Leptolyngbya sp. 15MV]